MKHDNKDYNVRVMCPHGDGDQWILVQNRHENLNQVLESAWDFECPTHGVQREFPLTAMENVAQRPRRILAAQEERWKQSAWSRPRAKELRHRKNMRVRVRGIDPNGNRFTQTAVSVNISRSGARLHGIGFIPPGGVVELRRFLRSARYRVIWAGQHGTSIENEMGIYCLEPQKNFWGLPERVRRG